MTTDKFNRYIMFNKIVGIENILVSRQAEEELHNFANSVILHYDRPASDEEVIRRIGDADCVLVSFTTKISRKVIDSCPNIRYIGMCCTLYSENSCNVDIAAAREKGIHVCGVRDYGDEGVAEYAVSELVRFLHGFGGDSWKRGRYELGGITVGIVGLGTTGRLCAGAFRNFGSRVVYFSRTRKEDAEAQGIQYLPLDLLLKESDAVITTLPRNTILLKKEQFDIFGNGKILMNTSIGPTFEVEALKEWLMNNPDSRYFCDGTGMGGLQKELSGFTNVTYTPIVAGSSVQSTERLSRKVLDNIKAFLGSEMPDR